MRDFKVSEIISDYESVQECRKWTKELPALHFKKE